MTQASRDGQTPGYLPPDGWVTVHQFESGDVILGEVGGDLDRTPGTNLVFAFGEGVDARFVGRVFHGAKLIGKATLLRHRLVFTGALGSPSVEPDDGRDVTGLVWELETRHLEQLDRSEGVPQRKKLASARVRVDGQSEDSTVRYYVHRAGLGGVDLPTLQDFRGFARSYLDQGLPLEQLEEALSLCV